MPDNINHLGLIALLFPRAKVIICRRDPRDIAVSCWQTGFRTCPWNNDWDHIARRLADYQRDRLTLERVRPIPWLEIPYEDVVADLEHHARLLIDFVGLEWHPACLEFHSNRRVVRTPSHAQVRQPIHSRSVARWRHYEQNLQPLFRAFERHGVDWKHAATDVLASRVEGERRCLSSHPRSYQTQKPPSSGANFALQKDAELEVTVAMTVIRESESVPKVKWCSVSGRGLSTYAG